MAADVVVAVVMGVVVGVIQDRVMLMCVAVVQPGVVGAARQAVGTTFVARR